MRYKITIDTSGAPPDPFGNPHQGTCESYRDGAELVCLHERNGEPQDQRVAVSTLLAGDRICLGINSPGCDYHGASLIASIEAWGA